VHRHTFYNPLFPGSQENGRRGGTENIPTIVALGKAAELAQQLLPTEMAREAALRDYLEEELFKKINGVSLNGEKIKRLCNTSNLSFTGIQAAEALLLLDREGLCCSAGSACNTKSKTPSHVLTAMGCTSAEARSSLRFSLGRFTTREEIDRALEIIPRVVKKLRGL
jgi:cysteine desulfurase